MFKIITTSNYGLESYCQTLVADHIPNKVVGNIMLNALQDMAGKGDTWYILVPQDKQLWLGMAEFADHTCEMCGADCFPGFGCMGYLP